MLTAQINNILLIFTIPRQSDWKNFFTFYVNKQLPSKLQHNADIKISKIADA